MVPQNPPRGRHRGAIRAVPLGDPSPIARAEFTDVAQTEWRAAKDAYLDAHRRMDSLLTLLHKPGQVKVSGQVTGAAYEAKQLRLEVDRMIVALDEIVSTARSVGEGG